MDIYAHKGAKVYFLGKNGYDSQLKLAMEIFEVSQELTVNRIDVGGWSSSVEFQEYPGKWFNTVMFEDKE